MRSVPVKVSASTDKHRDNEVPDSGSTPLRTALGMPERPHILFLSQSLPYPPHSGVTARTFNVLKQLHKEFDITLVAFSRLNHQPDALSRDNSRQALHQVASEVAVPTPVPSEHSTLRRVWDHLRSISSGKPYTYYEYSCSHFHTQLRDAIRARPPDLIHVDSLDLCRWIGELPPATTVCTHHSIESELLRRNANQLKFSVVRQYALHQATLLERLERELCPRFDANIMMSEIEAEKLHRVAPGSHTIVVPNGVDTDYFKPCKTSASVPGRLLFVGSPIVFPNRDALEYLLADIWPTIQASVRSASLQIIGRCSEADRRRYSAVAGVTCLGHVADIRPHVAEAHCCVVPIRVGGGTRIKILDAWAMGKAVVSTSTGCEGLQTIDGKNIFIRDTASSFAEAVVNVLSDSELQSFLAANGRQTAEHIYSWDIIGQHLRTCYRDQLQPV